MGQWDSGTVGQWDSGTVGQWDSGTLGVVVLVKDHGCGKCDSRTS